jgi:hypothetical protein
MKKLFVCLIFMFLLNAGYSYSQIINIQGGASFSKLDWKLGDNTEIFKNSLTGYSAFVGIDYMNSKFFNLSSNLGMIRKGGRDKIVYVSDIGVEPGINDNIASLDYVSINTTVEMKMPIQDKIIPFLSIGPRLDFLVLSNNIFDEVKKIDGFKKVSFGLLLGAGLKYDLSQWQIGVRADYCLNFTKIADWPAQSNYLGLNINDQTILLNLTIGYKLSKSTVAANP